MTALTGDERFIQTYLSMKKKRKGADKMCKAFDEIESRGKREGKREQSQVSIVKHVDSAMRNLNLKLKDACAALEVTEAEYWAAKRKTAKLMRQ